MICEALLCTVIRWLMIAGWVTLPLSHLKWLPPLGMTRPLCSIFFALAFGIILVCGVMQRGFGPSGHHGWDFLSRQLRQQPGWKFLRWWLILIILGILSAAITPFYGVPMQALNRLLGYALILIFLYSALYSLEAYHIETIAKWISFGYCAVLPYAIIEAMATQEAPWACKIVIWMRNTMIVPQVWDKRTAFFATEPSFLSFQLVLLMAIFPFLKSRVLCVANLLLMLIALFFSKSGMLFLIVTVYVFFYPLSSMNRKPRVWTIAIGSSTVIALGAIYRLSSTVQGHVAQLIQFLISHSYRLNEMRTSISIRGSYFLNLIYVLLDTHGIGLGIGQYGHFWKEIYLKHIDYRAFDKYGDVAKMLASSDYMRPWSVVLGIGVDLGVLGLGLFMAFMYQIFRACATSHARSIVLVSFFSLLGAYPIVTPHVWLALGLMGGHGILNYNNKWA